MPKSLKIGVGQVVHVKLLEIRTKYIAKLKKLDF